MYIRDKRPVKAGHVGFGEDRHGTVEGAIVYFPYDRYAVISSTTTTFTAFFSNQCYSNTSKDLNPIHANLYLSDITSPPRTTTYGMWTGAVGSGYLGSVVAGGRPKRVKL